MKLDQNDRGLSLVLENNFVSYQLVPNILLLLSIVGIILLILRRLPEAASVTESERKNPRLRIVFNRSDLINIFSTIKSFLAFWLKRLWHFVLEAKGMRHQSVTGYRIKQIFKKVPKRPTVDGVSARQEVQTIRDENYHLLMIKNNPHNLDNYKALGEYYLDLQNYSEAGNVYEYLVNHDSTNSGYYAKFGYCRLRQKNYEEAKTLYEKSIALDPTHPNRFYNLAICYESLGDFDKAFLAAEKAVALEPLDKKYRSMFEDLDRARKQ